MNRLPNVLTVLRIVLTIVFLFLISQNGLAPKIFAFLIFITASFTDFFDGYLAKKHNVTSDFGKLMDPIADKFLILSAFFIFTQMRLIAPWMFVVIFLREVIITAIRLQAMRQGRILPAERAGKYKTISQMVVICLILLFLILREISFFNTVPQILLGWQYSLYILMLMVVFLTLSSGIWYLLQGRLAHAR